MSTHAPSTRRVAYLVNQYPAVSQTFIRREIHALERRGFEVSRIALRGWDATLVDPDDQQELARTRYVLQQGGVRLGWAVLREAMTRPLKSLRALRLALQMARGSERPLAVHLVYLAEACLIRRWLADSGVPHLHAHFATNPAEVAMLVRELGGPTYSFTAHGSDIMDRPAQMGLDRKIGRAEFVAAVCWYGRSQMLRWVPRALWSRIFVVHCGLERGYGDAASPAVQTSARLLCIGRLSKEKGQLLLVEAAAQLAAAGLPVDIVMVGDGPLRGEIEALIERSGLRGRVRIAGWLDARQIRQQIADARALVVPSLSEGLPVVIMEAMASGRPVVAPFLAGIPELVTEGRTGWLYPAGSVSALSEALRLCLGTPAEQLESMGLQARARVRADHDVDVEAGKLAELLAPTGGEGLHGGEAV